MEYGFGPAGMRHAAESVTENSRRGLQWLHEQAWPLWLEHGVDWQRRGFLEHLDSGTLTCSADFRRLRVAARQTYVFSVAASQGFAGARDAVELGLEFLKGPARLREGGFAWRFDLDNKPIDVTRDLYDHAFVLLAFATAASVAKRESMRAEALGLIDYIVATFRHPRGGFEESVPPAQPRRQNPHMHLLEAVLAAHEAFGDAVFLDHARELVDLFLDRFFQTDDGALPEFFDEDLVPVREHAKYLIEPGHHFEWVWLLDRYAKAASSAGKPVRSEIVGTTSALLRFADGFGVDAAKGLVVDGVWRDGSLQSGGFRLWPQTERIKGEIRRESGAAEACCTAFAGLWRLLDGVRPGLWRERVNPDGSWAVSPSPATSLYHLTAALTDPALTKEEPVRAGAADLVDS